MESVKISVMDKAVTHSIQADYYKQIIITNLILCIFCDTLSAEKSMMTITCKTSVYLILLSSNFVDSGPCI